MERLIRTRYKKETKVIEAVSPRNFTDSTLVAHTDILSIVCDIYTLVETDVDRSFPRVNLLFLHGSGMSRCVWEYYVAHLLDQKLNWQVGKIILMDQVTHGDSGVLNADKLSVKFDWVDGARDACKVAQNEFFDGTLAYNVVIGHSMGGFQALSCGVLMPSLFQLILVIEPVALMYNGKDAKNEYTVIPKKFYQALYSKMEDTFRSEREYEAYMRQRSFFPRVHPEILQRIIDFERITLPNGKIKTKMNQRQNILCYITLHPTAKWLLKSLEFIRVPVVSIVGGASKWSPKENEKFLEKSIPNYTRDIVPEGDHLLNIENPEETLSRLLCHISKFIAATDNGKNLGGQDLTTNERAKLFDAEFERFTAKRVEDRPLELSKF